MLQKTATVLARDTNRGSAEPCPAVKVREGVQPKALLPLMLPEHLLPARQYSRCFEFDGKQHRQVPALMELTTEWKRQTIINSDKYYDEEVAQQRLIRMI